MSRLRDSAHTWSHHLYEHTPSHCTDPMIQALLNLWCVQFGALTFHNFAKLEHYSPPLCQAMDDLLAEGSPEWTPKLISFTLWAFAKLRHMPGPAARALVEDWLAR